jgi:two-component system OmpR family sensor kinase/two-component system sensor histidine kinase BaeS
LHDRPVRRGHFFWRLASVALAVLLLAACGAVALVWLAATSLGIGAASPGAVAVMLLGGGTLAVVAAAFALSRVMRRVAMPLGAVMDAADRVAGGDYSVRVGEHGPPPIRALGRAFNTMTGRLQDHDRLRRDLMADVAHELRTPLTVMQGKLEGLLDGVYPRDDRQLEELLEETHVLSRLVEDLRTVALSESGALKLQKELTDLGGLARDVARALAGDAAAHHVTLEVDAAADLAPIAIDPVRIREVLTNLLSNALRHTPSGGSVAVRVTATPSGGVSVDVRDTGTGMAPDDVARAFERFYKGPESRGSGLGLTIARGLVVAHGGEIHASSEIGLGTTITFTLP